MTEKKMDSNRNQSNSSHEMMDTSSENIDSNRNQSNSSHEMEYTSSESIVLDHGILQEGDSEGISGEWSVTTSELNSLDTTSSNPYINIDTLKECCADSSDTLNEKNDFIVVESPAVKCNADETRNFTICKPSAFQKKHKSSFNNMSCAFENILDDNSQIEESICLNRFQKRKRLLPPNDEDFVEINNSDNSKIDTSCDNLKSSKNNFKHPSNFSLLNSSTYSVNESKTEVLPHKFIRKTIDLANSAFENIIMDSSTTSSVEINNKISSFNESSLSSSNKNSLCDTESIPNLNHTYNVPINSTQVGVLSQSMKMYSELSNIEQPINETYTLENDSVSGNVVIPLNEPKEDSLNAKNVLSDTYTIESNWNYDTSAQLKSGLKSSKNITSTSTDMSNIYNQSKSSARKPNFIRKLQLDEGSQEFNFTIYGDDNSTDNDEINQTKDNASERFKLNKVHHSTNNSVIFENVITSHRNEVSTTDTSFKTLNASAKISKNDCSMNTSSNSKIKENLEESVNKSMTQLSNTHRSEFFENNKNISGPSLSLKLNDSNRSFQQSSKFNFSKRFGRLSQSFHENSLHDLSIPQNTTFMLSQSQNPHFVGKHNLNAHSVVFNDIIDKSSSSDTSLNVSKEIKFKNLKHLAESNSITFENVIRNSQESNNSTLPQNQTISRSVMYDESKIQANDEISLFANADELSYDEKSLSYSKNSFKNLDNDEINLKKSKYFENSLNNISAVSSVIDESNKSLIKKNDVENISSRSSRTSINVAHSNQENTNTNDANNSEFCLSPKSSMESAKTYDSTLILEIDSNDVDTISTSLAKQSNNSLASDQSISSRIINELSNNNKSLTNETISKNESLGSKNNINNVADCSSKTSKSIDYSNCGNSKNNETNDSEFSVSSKSSIDSEKTYNSSIMIEIDSTDADTISTSLSKSSNNLLANDQSTDLIITNKSQKNNKSASSETTRLSSVSIENNKPLTNKTGTPNESMISVNNENSMSNCSSKISKLVAYSNSENTDTETHDSGSVFWTSSNSSTFEGNQNSISDISTSLSKQYNNMAANDQPKVSSIIGELSSSAVTRSSSVSVKNNKSVFFNESWAIENNVSKVSIYSPKSVLQFNTKNVCNGTDDSVIWTLSEDLNDSRKTTNNTSITADMNDVGTISTSLLQQTNNQLAKDPPAVSSVIDESQDYSKSSSTKAIGLSSVLVKNNKSLIDTESLIANNVSKISTRSSKRVAQSNTENVINETNDSVFWTTLSEGSSYSRKISNNTLTAGDINDVGTVCTSLLQQTNNSLANDLLAVSSISDDESQDNNKSLVSYNKSLVAENNVSKISTRSSKRLANTENIDNETNGSMFWTTASESSCDSRQTFNDTSIPDDNMNNVDAMSTSLLQQTNNSFTSDLPAVSFSIDESRKNNDSSSTNAIKLSSVTVKKNKSILSNKSLASKNNVSKISTRSSKRVTQANTENIGNETNGSMFWTTISESSSDSSKISNSTLIPNDDIDGVGAMSINLSKEKKNAAANDLPPVSSIIDKFPDNKPSSTRVTRSSSKSFKNNSSVSENNTKYMSSRSSRSSKTVAHSDNGSIDGVTDNSMAWTTVTNSSTSDLPIQNGFQTPTNDKIDIKESIINAIRIMSVNKRKSTHPGVFELEGNEARLSKRLSTLSSNHSPSILTKVLVANDTIESTSSFIENISIDQSQVENNVKEKFESLYNKESWITKRLYKFLVCKLQLKYGIYSVKYAEKFVKYLASILKQVRRNEVDFQLYTDMLRYQMARYGFIIDTADYVGFLTDYLPLIFCNRLMPGWNLETSAVKFDVHKYFIPIMEDEEFLRMVHEKLNVA